MVIESYGNRVLLGKQNWYGADYILSRDKKNYVTGTWCIKFNNDNVVNPPGVFYCHPETKIRLLKKRQS